MLGNAPCFTFGKLPVNIGREFIADMALKHRRLLPSPEDGGAGAPGIYGRDSGARRRFRQSNRESARSPRTTNLRRSAKRSAALALARAPLWRLRLPLQAGPS